MKKTIPSIERIEAVATMGLGFTVKDRDETSVRLSRKGAEALVAFNPRSGISVFSDTLTASQALIKALASEMGYPVENTDIPASDIRDGREAPEYAHFLEHTKAGLALVAQTEIVDAEEGLDMGGYIWNVLDEKGVSVLKGHDMNDVYHAFNARHNRAERALDVAIEDAAAIRSLLEGGALLVLEATPRDWQNPSRPSEGRRCEATVATGDTAEAGICFVLNKAGEVDGLEPASAPALARVLAQLPATLPEIGVGAIRYGVERALAERTRTHTRTHAKQQER